MNNKKITIVFILVSFAILIGIGITFAYFTSSTDFENEFQTGLYQTEATEVFESPQNWMPGDTTPKELTITNTGNVDVKARVCISEEWESAIGDTLNNNYYNYETDSYEKVAILNIDNTSDWTQHGNCYEYNDVLEPDDETTSFIKSVTFNPNIEAYLYCTTTTNNGVITKSCTNSGEGYDNATYTLTFTVETVQANAYRAVWGYYVGEEICFSTECFYVVNSNTNKTALMSKYNLLIGDVFDVDKTDDTYTLNKTFSTNDTGYGLQNSTAKGWVPLESGETTSRYIATVGFSGTNYWDNSECQYYSEYWESWGCIGTTGLLSEYSQNGETYYRFPFDINNPYVYRSNMNTIAPNILYDPISGYAGVENNGYSIAYYVEEYVNTLKSLGAPNTIEGRLPSIDDVTNIGCKQTSTTCITETSQEWAYSSSYWLGSAYDSNKLWYVQSDGRFSGYFGVHAHLNGVRPVIEIPTSELN